MAFPADFCKLCGNIVPIVDLRIRLGLPTTFRLVANDSLQAKAMG